ncbi:hypothetical protein QR680_003419 [Steinernema hermaphroditum]|uniref:Uncharacterized protein n=1 Tax=Steinernema hermaphroditum TaxID=289476 RepID=A0AA39LJQ0_9BILA|nr:hypothetical protein QR680_003419 [Steinernema hermaphroditum]
MFSTALLVLLVAIVGTNARHIQIHIRDNITQSCPNVRSDIIDQHSIRLSFDMLPSDNPHGSKDQVTVVTRDGQARTVHFPGCYQVKLSFRMKKVIVNPYIEAFLQMGTNLPCQADHEEDAGTLSHICGNVTKTNWCPQSQNQKLRSQLNMKSTCRFCNLCQTVQAEGGQTRKYITLDNPHQECRTDQDIQTISFKMCTPDKKDIRKANTEHEGKLEEYWNYLKQGVLTAVVHVMDRGVVSDTMKNQCARMCSILEGQSVSASYRTTLMETIQTRCVPQDTYAACVYHTLKFDVNGDH